MNGCLHKLRSVRILLALLVLPGLFIRVIVPPGFMPVASRGATLTMAMCPGHAQQPADLLSGPAPDDGGQPARKHREPPCVFAATAGGATPIAITADVDLPTIAQDVVLPRIVAPAVRRQVLSAHAPRGPPASV